MDDRYTDKIISIAFDRGAMYGVSERGILYKLTSSKGEETWTVVANSPRMDECAQIRRSSELTIKPIFSKTEKTPVIDASKETPIPLYNIFEHCS